VTYRSIVCASLRLKAIPKEEHAKGMYAALSHVGSYNGGRGLKAIWFEIGKGPIDRLISSLIDPIVIL